MKIRNSLEAKIQVISIFYLEKLAWVWASQQNPLVCPTFS